MSKEAKDWQFVLPDGWTSEKQERSESYTIRLPDRLGYLTIDFKFRRFAPGFRGRVNTNDNKAPRTYSHRGWPQKLVNDAVEWARRELGAR